MNFNIHKIAASRTLEIVSNLLHAAVAMPFGYAVVVVIAHLSPHLA